MNSLSCGHWFNLTIVDSNVLFSSPIVKINIDEPQSIHTLAFLLLMFSGNFAPTIFRCGSIFKAAFAALTRWTSPHGPQSYLNSNEQYNCLDLLTHPIEFSCGKWTFFISPNSLRSWFVCLWINRNADHPRFPLPGTRVCSGPMFCKLYMSLLLPGTVTCVLTWNPGDRSCSIVGYLRVIPLEIPSRFLCCFSWLAVLFLP